MGVVFIKIRNQWIALFFLTLLLAPAFVKSQAMAAPPLPASPAAVVRPAAALPEVKLPPPVPAPVIKSETAILMQAGKKQVLFDKDANKIMYPASTTKIMTLITALQHGNINDTVVIGPDPLDIEGSSMELRLFDRLPLRELLYGLMLASGNDAAHAVAEHVGGGSYSRFIGWMNDDAEKIGALRTHFSNPHGLPDPINHFTTAYDLALLADAGFKVRGFEEFVSTQYHTVIYQNRAKGTPLVNTNKLLMTYSGANGVKTGTTRAAGRCLVSSARRGDTLLIAVVLNGGENVYRDSALLLDYGFRVLGK